MSSSHNSDSNEAHQRARQNQPWGYQQLLRTVGLTGSSWRRSQDNNLPLTVPGYQQHMNKGHEYRELLTRQSQDRHEAWDAVPDAIRPCSLVGISFSELLVSYSHRLTIGSIKPISLPSQHVFPEPVILSTLIIRRPYHFHPALHQTDPALRSVNFC